MAILVHSEQHAEKQSWVMENEPGTLSEHLDPAMPEVGVSPLANKRGKINEALLDCSEL